MTHINLIMHKSILSYLVLSVLGLNFISCNIFNEGNQASSFTIKESRERNVFVCEYQPPGGLGLYRINDSIALDVKEVWLEKIWYRGHWKSTTKLSKTGGFQLRVISDTIIKHYLFRKKPWTLGEDLDWLLWNGALYLDEIPTQDTLVFPVVKNHKSDWNRNYKKKHGPKVNLGKFILIRKDS